MAVVRLHLTLIARAGNRKELTLEARKPVALVRVLEDLGVPPEEVGIIVRNGRTENIDCLVHPEDTLELFPVISGG
jgi:hypothetical protein